MADLRDQVFKNKEDLEKDTIEKFKLKSIETSSRILWNMSDRIWLHLSLLYLLPWMTRIKLINVA